MTGSYERPTETSAGYRTALNEALSALLSIRLSLQIIGGKVADEEGALRCQQVGAQALRQIRLHRIGVRTLHPGAHRAVGDHVARRPASRCLNLDQLHAARRSGLNGYSGLATLEVLGYQSNELLIGFAIDRR